MLSREAGLDQLDFLLGRWVGGRSGDAVEEVWTRPTTTTMMGMFCWSHADEPQLLEFLVLEARPTGIALELRAFSSGSGLPSHTTRPPHWRLARVGENEVAFDTREDGKVTRITYRREREDLLYASLERHEHGRNRIYPYHYRAAQFAPADAAGKS